MQIVMYFNIREAPDVPLLCAIFGSGELKRTTGARGSRWGVCVCGFPPMDEIN